MRYHRYHLHTFKRPQEEGNSNRDTLENEPQSTTTTTLYSQRFFFVSTAPLSQSERERDIVSRYEDKPNLYTHKQTKQTRTHTPSARIPMANARLTEIHRQPSVKPKIYLI